MNVQVEKLEKSMAKLTIELTAEQFDKSLEKSFKKNKNRFQIPGFRKGKVTRAIVERMYGASILYDDAADDAINSTCFQAMDESGLDIVSRPEVNLIQIEKGKPFIYTALVAVKPEVTLGEYKGIEVKKADASVTEADIEAELKKVQEQNARLLSVEDRPVADGDQTVIDFEGFVDGKPFDGGKAEDYQLTIGSHTFIDTFEEQLIGKNIGEPCEINVTFPEDYGAKDLAGKPALFKVTVKSVKVKELPELDDDFAGEVSDFDTLDEYKKDIEEKVSERKKRAAASENENRVVNKVVEGTAIEIPERMIEDRIERRYRDMCRNMEQQDFSMEQYLKYSGQTEETMKEQFRPQVVEQIRMRLTLEAVVKAENIEISQESLDAEIERMATQYKMELEDLKKVLTDREVAEIKENLAVQEAIDLLVAEAKLV